MSKEKITWHVERRRIEDIKPHEENPRIFTEKGMKDLNKSIDSIGFAQPVNINTDGTCLSGHARVEVLKQHGETEVDVYVPNRKLTPKEEKEVLIRMNANTAGVFDEKKLELCFDFNDLTDWGMDNLDDLFKEPEDPEIEEDDFVEPTDEEMAEVQTDIKQGDMFKLGDHIVLCGDSTNPEDVARLLGGPDVKVDLVHTDPPYGVSYKGTNNPNGKEWEIIKTTSFVGMSYFYFCFI